MKRSDIPFLNALGTRSTVEPLPQPITIAEPEPMPKPEPVAEPSVEPVTTLALARGQCKFPVNDGKPEWLHCGARATGPYCDSHRARMYSKSHRDAA